MYIDFDGSAAGPLWGPNFVMVGYDDNGVGHTCRFSLTFVTMNCETPASRSTFTSCLIP